MSIKIEVFATDNELCMVKFYKAYLEKVTGHSSIAGLCTLMAQAEFRELEIKSIGRWSSEAFLTYVKRAG